jgi:hypothetical protein
VTERRVPLARRDTADGDVERVGATDSAGAHSDEHVVPTGLRTLGVDDFCPTGAGDHGRFHGVSSSSNVEGVQVFGEDRLELFDRQAVLIQASL